MNLKDQMLADVAAVFLNRDEFAVPVVIEGVETSGVWSDSWEPYKDYHHDSLPRLPLDVDERVLEIPEGIVDAQPDQELEVDGVLYIVRKVQPWDGMLYLILYRNVAV